MKALIGKVQTVQTRWTTTIIMNEKNRIKILYISYHMKFTPNIFQLDTTEKDIAC